MGEIALIVLLVVVVAVLWLATPVLVMSRSFRHFEQATKIPVDFWQVPGHPIPLVVAFQAAGFEMLGGVTAPSPGAPTAWTIIGVHRELPGFCRIWVGADGTTGPYSIKTRLDRGTLATTTVITTPLLPTSLEQSVPGASPAELVDAHRAALTFLGHHGRFPVPAHPEEWFSFFVEEWDAEAAAVRSLSAGGRWGFAARVRVAQLRGGRALADQPGIEARLRQPPFA